MADSVFIQFPLVLIVGPLGAVLAIACYGVGFALFLVLLFTGIGPAVHWALSRRDERVWLSRDALAARCGATLRFVRVRDHELGVIFTPPAPGSPTRPFPIVIPNGMGSTAAMLGRLQDRLNEAGFAVLTYDRYGCGFSERNRTGASPTVAETLADMDAVMRAVLPEEGQRWIVIGPSMGSIVAQAFIAQQPHRVAGFVNLDGLPYPFHNARALFKTFGRIYRVESALVWTGLFRPALALFGSALLEADFASGRFPVGFLVAQANAPPFLENIGFEMGLMIDLAADVSKAWGEQSVETLAPEQLATLLRAPPTHTGDEDAGGKWVEAARPEGDARDAADARVLVASLLARPHSRLATAWAALSVRVLASRHYPYPLLVYTQAMRDWAGAEHVAHELLAASAERRVFPARSHGSMFAAYDTTVATVVGLSDELQARALEAGPTCSSALLRQG